MWTSVEKWGWDADLYYTGHRCRLNHFGMEDSCGILFQVMVDQIHIAIGTIVAVVKDHQRLFGGGQLLFDKFALLYG